MHLKFVLQEDENVLQLFPLSVVNFDSFSVAQYISFDLFYPSVFLFL